MQFYAGDPDFKPTLQVTSGNAFGGEDVGFVAFTGYDAGFAADYETLSFKVKGLPGDELEIKFFGSPENSIIINLGDLCGCDGTGQRLVSGNGTDERLRRECLRIHRLPDRTSG